MNRNHHHGRFFPRWARRYTNRTRPPTPRHRQIPTQMNINLSDKCYQRYENELPLVPGPYKVSELKMHTPPSGPFPMNQNASSEVTIHQVLAGSTQNTAIRQSNCPLHCFRKTITPLCAPLPQSECAGIRSNSDSPSSNSTLTNQIIVDLRMPSTNKSNPSTRIIPPN